MSGDVERLSGFAATLLAHYDLQAGDVMIIVSNSGINHLPIEIALESKTRGLTVIGLTCSTLTLTEPRGMTRFALPDFYVYCVTKGGGLPLLLPNIAATAAASYLARVDGLVLSGGVDVDPDLYEKAQEWERKYGRRFNYVIEDQAQESL